IEVHGNHASLATVRPRHRGAADGGEPDADLVLAEVVNFLFAQLFAGEAVLQDGNRRGVVTDDQWRRHSRRHLAKNGLGDGSDLGHAGIHGRARLEKDFNDAHAIVGIGLDVFDVVYRGTERALVVIHDTLLDFGRVQAGV